MISITDEEQSEDAKERFTWLVYSEIICLLFWHVGCNKTKIMEPRKSVVLGERCILRKLDFAASFLMGLLKTLVTASTNAVTLFCLADMYS